MHQLMVKPLPSGCRLTAIFDASHQKVSVKYMLILEYSPVTQALHWVSFRHSSSYFTNLLIRL